MKQRNRILALAVALALALGGFAAWAEEDASATQAPAEPPLAEGKGWTLSRDGRMKVTAEARLGYDNRADVEWYDYMDRIYYLEIGEGVERLGAYVFCDAVNLRHVFFPEGLKSIGLRAFSHCEALQALKLPDSLESIDYWAFAGCNFVEQIVAGNAGMRQIDNYAFQNCQSLLRVVVLDSVERLGFDVLEDCRVMRELYLPASLKLIDKCALRRCSALTDIYFAGSEAQWKAVRVEEGNGETMGQVTIHYDSPWNPDAAAHVSTLRPKHDKESWVQMWRSIQMYYSQRDYYALIKGNLENADMLLAAAGVDRATMESFLENNYDECVFIPRGQTFYDVNCYCVTKAGTTDFDADESLTRLLSDRPDDAAAYLDAVAEHMGLGDLAGYEEYGGITFAVYRPGTDHVYVTVLNGYVFTLHFCVHTGHEAEREAMETDIMSTICIYKDPSEQAEQPAQTEQPEGAEDAQAPGLDYSFMDGRLTLRLDPEVYDVFLQDNSGNEAVLERQGLPQDRMDLYMQGLGYQLMAVPAGTPFLQSDWRFLLHIKEPKYTGIKNLKDIGETEERILIDVIVKSFGISDWELVHAGAVDYFVFEALGSVRYATIVDERMIYLYVKSDKGAVSDAHREVLRSIMEGVRWNLG